jgi:NitT/TauT family transport system substrate-binding protein
MHGRFAGAALMMLCAAAAPGCSQGPKDSNAPVEVRAGHFPNITHAQPLVGKARGRFESALKGQATVSWKVFNAGPSAIEALFAGELDLAYVGPGPAITGYVRSDGRALRVVAGACSGGAALVVRADAGIEQPADFAGKSLATPQLGNTQDISARFWLIDHGLDWLERGGTVRVLPLANPDQLTLFLKKELDAAWTVEPWVSRLEQEAGGRVFLEEGSLWPGGKYVTTNLVVATPFLEKHPDLVRAWIAEHVAITSWIRENQDEALKLINEEIRRDTGAALPEAILQSSFRRLELTDDPLRDTVRTSADRSFQLGFLGRKPPDVSGLHDLRLLNEVRAAAGLAAIP